MKVDFFVAVLYCQNSRLREDVAMSTELGSILRPLDLRGGLTNIGSRLPVLHGRMVLGHGHGPKAKRAMKRSLKVLGIEPSYMPCTNIPSIQRRSTA